MVGPPNAEPVRAARIGRRGKRDQRPTLAAEYPGLHGFEGWQRRRHRAEADQVCHTDDQTYARSSHCSTSSVGKLSPVGAEFAKLLYDLGGYKNTATALPTPARFRSQGPQMFGSPKI